MNDMDASTPNLSVQAGVGELPPAPKRRGLWFLIAGCSVGLILIVVIVVGRSASHPSATSDGTAQPPVTTPRVDPLPHDKDRDGFSDVEEAKAGTSDLEFDTDHDGLSDRDELSVWKTDPAKADTDGDGFTDGFEVVHGYNPLGKGPLPKT